MNTGDYLTHFDGRQLGGTGKQTVEELANATAPGPASCATFSTTVPTFKPAQVYSTPPVAGAALAGATFAEGTPPRFADPGCSLASLGVAPGDVVLKAQVDGALWDTTGLSGPAFAQSVAAAAGVAFATVLSTRDPIFGAVPKTAHSLPWLDLNMIQSAQPASAPVPGAVAPAAQPLYQAVGQAPAQRGATVLLAQPLQAQPVQGTVLQGTVLQAQPIEMQPLKQE